MKYYDFGCIKASIENTCGKYKTVVKENNNTWVHIHKNETDALKEIISYCEIESDDF